MLDVLHCLTDVIRFETVPKVLCPLWKIGNGGPQRTRAPVCATFTLLLALLCLFAAAGLWHALETGVRSHHSLATPLTGR